MNTRQIHFEDGPKDGLSMTIREPIPYKVDAEAGQYHLEQYPKRLVYRFKAKRGRKHSADGRKRFHLSLNPKIAAAAKAKLPNKRAFSGLVEELLEEWSKEKNAKHTDQP
jgi:hypothetical protein